MVRTVNREYLVQRVQQWYNDQEKNCCFFVVIVIVFFIKNRK